MGGHNLTLLMILLLYKCSKLTTLELKTSAILRNFEFDTFVPRDTRVTRAANGQRVFFVSSLSNGNFANFCELDPM